MGLYLFAFSQSRPAELFQVVRGLLRTPPQVEIADHLVVLCKEFAHHFADKVALIRSDLDALLELHMRIKGGRVLVDQAQEENENLKQQIEELSLEAVVLQRKLVFKEANSSGAIEKLQSEHVNSQQHIKDLEAKLEKIQSNLLEKLKALDVIEEKNASLQEEIFSLRNALQYVKRSETTARSNSSIPHTALQFQESSVSKGNITAKPSEKVLYSRFAHSASIVNLSPTKSSSRMVRFPISSLLTLDKSPGISSGSFLLQKQCTPCSSISNIDSNVLGQGQDYVRALFSGSKKTVSEVPPVMKLGKQHIPTEYYDSSASSAVGNLKIVEVHSCGHYVKILNTSQDKEEGIGDHTLQQNLNGHPVAVYKFPPKIRMKANSSITVWAVCSKMTHRPPTDYLWKDMDKFNPGPECTTILCGPTGQAVAWYTPINWNREQTKKDEEGDNFCRNLLQPIIGVHQQQDRWETRAFETWQGSVSQSNTKENEPEFILREEKMPPTLFPVQNSWCRSPSSSTHPHYTMGRYLALGGDKSHACTRTQPVQPNLDLEFSCGKKSRKESGNRKSTRATRSIGPNLGGVIYVGSETPTGSALQKYFAHSSYHFRLPAQASPTRISFL
ncbi:lamin tail domain-containing protein 1 [Sceloporus undulatus]|uniref:lamin tail domain-containing protein 1 n=1 Tax=Sceloporus undulatus TaxID=8520 RepID=UPI001C4D8C63|nr:lamin tail domain-containing protein 1 [Sceloporus undulatus]